MLQLGGDPDLAQEPPAPMVADSSGLSTLMATRALVLHVSGEKEDGHPALAQQALDVVVPRERFPQSLQLIGRGNSR